MLGAVAQGRGSDNHSSRIVPRPGDAVGGARRATESSQVGNAVTQLRFSPAECEKQEEKRCKADAVFCFHGWKNRGTKTASPPGLQTTGRASKTKEMRPFTALAEGQLPAQSTRWHDEPYGSLPRADASRRAPSGKTKSARFSVSLSRDESLEVPRQTGSNRRPHHLRLRKPSVQDWESETGLITTFVSCEIVCADAAITIKHAAFK